MLESLQAGDSAAATLDRAVLARLVLDGMIEIEVDGLPLSGPVAHPLFFSGSSGTDEGVIATLSLEALRAAASTGLTDPMLLAGRLYRYNTRPTSPHWRRRWPDDGAVSRLLDVNHRVRQVGGTKHQDLISAYGDRAVWRIWDSDRLPAPRPGTQTYKLYLSPTIVGVTESLAAALSLFRSAFSPFSLKVGRDLPSLLRPDKMVAYFASRDGLLAAAEYLRGNLAGLEAQGVPFTSELSGRGLLSEAADPTDEAEPPGPRRHGSWRSWVTARLGGAMGAALQSDADVSSIRYALDRTSLDGVDTARWIPPSWFDQATQAHADH
ncbi:MAG TPA: hypothetical protein VF187_01350 [Gemmatimonadales bacterium]